MIELAIAVFSVCMPMTASIVYATVKLRGNGQYAGNGKYVSTTTYFEDRRDLNARLGRIESDVKDILKKL